ncbi:ribonuclease HII [Mycoplasma corogypsi]|uniref:ribonuclease HII n=1 Tax=Mycoplasma corogypsi TaxID=2106 RepID=UPI0038733EC3
MSKIEKELWKEYEYIVGCDEVGRGCFAGPLVAACVMLPKGYLNHEINDSKKVKVDLRIVLDKIIREKAIEYQIVTLDAYEPDFNPKTASKKAMEMAINNFKHKIDLIITDYENIETNKEQINLIKGDNLSFNVASASIIAKVFRDNLMATFDDVYPGYDFKSHKGYGTKYHKEAIEKLGISPIHRIAYRPIKALLKKMNSEEK